LEGFIIGPFFVLAFPFPLSTGTAATADEGTVAFEEVAAFKGVVLEDDGLLCETFPTGVATVWRTESLVYNIISFNQRW